MRILITGASGQLGIELSRLLSERHEVIKVYNSSEVQGGYKLDLTDFPRLEDFIIKKKPDVIINTAAMTDVDKCEIEKEKAYKINAEAVRHIIRAGKVIDSYIIHISTDYVFDGEKGNYKEEDIPNPINYYGLSKLLGETFALQDDSLIVRTSGVFRNKGFPIYVYKTLKEGKTVFAFKGYYSPISARKLASAILELLELRKTGIIHVAGERISRFELALKIKEKFNLPGDVKEVDEVKGWIAKRPYDSSLDSSRARKILSSDFHTLDLDGMVV
ncbi:dTDP-4-dehydrorhamnose reductase [Sulfurisphaera ohwakuensis]|uniref:dTDP-4-dehydrorhamnose reductase n=1 Tax=Sulfurisphaera ohwakuensis TaxID=69656 RepID=A0A650CI93_SULOH|nr:dTDP-4-dehydrorhamnose reductase [Sulfurisphaera ohwakuensis]MBB5255013.1 dTDP-4-dehydrorhamnose reductase [Sulfurisphaera ohwakuensis]QGR17267.1 dTDP-4-dehydrorhamnose reductase [Sulfurisphaera ohwakuensis]